MEKEAQQTQQGIELFEQNILCNFLKEVLPLAGLANARPFSTDLSISSDLTFKTKSS